MMDIGDLVDNKRWISRSEFAILLSNDLLGLPRDRSILNVH